MSDQSDDLPVETSGPGPSAALVAAREKLGLSQKDVADKLFLTVTFIRYIDDGEFHRIPKPAFIKGYLRSYARLVELSGDEIVEQYEAELELEAAEPASEIRGVTEEQVGTSSITGPVFQTGVFGLIGLLFVVMIIWWVSGPESTESPAEGSAVSNLDIDGNSPSDFDYVLGETGEDAVELEIAPAQSEELNQAGEISELPEEIAETTEIVEEAARSVEQQASTDSPERSENAAPAEVSIERIQDGNREFVTVDAHGFDQIELRFSDECWVSITDSIRGVIYEDLNRDGDVVTLYGTRPFQVLLGKATGVEMIYNGAPFELEPHTASDRTAKLTISE